MFKVDSAGVRKQLKWSCQSPHTHTHTHISSSIANLTALVVLYQNKIQCQTSAPTSVTIGTRLMYKPIICIINNSFAFRYVTSQIWKLYGIFVFVWMREVGHTSTKLHFANSWVRKRLKYTPLSVYYDPVPNGTLNPCGLPLSPHFRDVMPLWLSARSLLRSSLQCGLGRSADRGRITAAKHPSER